MRILHTVAFYPPDNGGGATEVVKQLSERLALKGHSVTVATSSNGAELEQKINGVAVRRFRIRSVLGQSVLGVFGEKEMYKRELLSDRYDLIMNYAAQTWHTDCLVENIDEVKAVKVLCTCGFSGLLGWRRMFYRSYYRKMRRILPKYDMLVHHSSEYRDARFAAEIPGVNSVVVPNGVDSSLFCEAELGEKRFRKKYKIESKYIILCVGDHFRNKGHSRVIDAFKRIPKHDMTLIIVGRHSAGYGRSCSDNCLHASRNSDGKIRLLMGIARDDVIDAFSSCDLVVSGSLVEAAPLILLESMAAGKPFVCFPAGNASELEGGVVVGTIDEMALGIRSLLENPNYRKVLGARGRRHQQSTYEWNNVVGAYESLYRALIARKVASKG